MFILLVYMYIYTLFLQRLGKLMGLYKDPIRMSIWAYTSQNVFKYKVTREARLDNMFTTEIVLLIMLTVAVSRKSPDIICLLSSEGISNIDTKYFIGLQNIFLSAFVSETEHLQKNEASIKLPT